MDNFVSVLNDLFNDNESNEMIENSLNLFFRQQLEYYLSDVEFNLKFMIGLVGKSIDYENKTINENELRYRAKLMNKYIIRDYFQYYLQLLLGIASLGKSKGLPVSEIDAIIDILQRENVIIQFVRSHWFCAKGNPNSIIEDRCKAIRQCIQFLSKMDDFNSSDDL